MSSGLEGNPSEGVAESSSSELYHRKSLGKSGVSKFFEGNKNESGKKLSSGPNSLEEHEVIHDFGSDRDTDPLIVEDTNDNVPERSRKMSTRSVRSVVSQYHTFDHFASFDSDLRSATYSLGHSRKGRLRESLSFSQIWKLIRNARPPNKEQFINECVKRPILYIPSVILGTLLNILDGLSYGMILFPLNIPLFSHLGPAGLSIFFVSCVVSQLVYSLGASNFKCGIGSEMIEVVPFFHTMAQTILSEVGEQNPRAVIATTIFSYAASSVLTGIVFFALGLSGLGSLIGFFPRHILVGCVGGVGWFLFVTGIEISSAISGLGAGSFSQLFIPSIFLKWTLPLLLAVILMAIEHRIKHPMLVPTYFIFIFLAFHFIIWIVPQFSLEAAQTHGWAFQAPLVSEPWYYFYSLYDFKATDWFAFIKTIPAMFALTFFGLLHVPINVPSLALSIGEDNVDVDKELIAHGISNTLSGLFGSIQNYLVYTNSVLFIKSGADERLAGVMLAIATAMVMMAGTTIIGYIPIMVVGALIYLLGIELLIEALVDTWTKVSNFEYLTIIVIIVTMGLWDFIYGIIIGIVLACFSFVIQASRNSVIQAAFNGAVARSTVRRHYNLQMFLSEVGNQIYVLKLSGYVFFGTIVGIERAVRELLDDSSEESQFSHSPIRYLIIDIEGVTDIDYSASEAFARMKRLLDTKGTFMMLSGASKDVQKLRGLKAIDLFREYDGDSEYPVRLFPNLNMALEWCENEFLGDYYKHREIYRQREDSNEVKTRTNNRQNNDLFAEYSMSPRQWSLQKAVQHIAPNDVTISNKWSKFKQPLPLLMQVFQGVSNKTEDFWFQVAPFFEKQKLSAGTVLYESDNSAKGFYLVESGILRADYELEQGRIYESILAGTSCGELPFFSETNRTATVHAETDVVVWKLDRDNWEALKKEPNGLAVANELLVVALKLTVERFNSITAYIMISSS